MNLKFLFFLSKIEKLAEAQRKFENLKSELKGTNDFIEIKKKFKSKSLVVKSVEDDQDEDDLQTTSFLKRQPSSTVDPSEKSTLRNRKSSAFEDSNTNQSFAQRLLEKNRERQMKQKKFRKEHDLKLAFSEFYLSLILLQNYQTLNFTGFRKILKKHDKVLCLLIFCLKKDSKCSNQI